MNVWQVIWIGLLAVSLWDMASKWGTQTEPRVINGYDLAVWVTFVVLLWGAGVFS